MVTVHLAKDMIVEDVYNFLNKL